MADKKHKTKAELLDELESIKGLLDDVSEDELPSPDEVPLLSEVVEETSPTAPPTLDSPIRKPDDTEANVDQPCDPSDAGDNTGEGVDIAGVDTDEGIAEIRLAYQQVLEESDLPHTPDAALVDESATQAALNQTLNQSEPLNQREKRDHSDTLPGGFNQPLAIPAVTDPDIHLETDTEITLSTDTTTAPQERTETQQCLFGDLSLPSDTPAANDIQTHEQESADETLAAGASASARASAPEVAAAPEVAEAEPTRSEEELPHPGENPFLPKHIREKQKGLQFDAPAAEDNSPVAEAAAEEASASNNTSPGNTSPGNTSPGNTSPSNASQNSASPNDFEHLTSQVLEDVIRDFTPKIEAELHKRLRALMEQQLRELDWDLDNCDDLLDTPPQDDRD